MANNFLRDLVHPDVKYSSRVVENFFQSLINDSLELRKLNIRTCLYVLKQQKRPLKKLQIKIKRCNTKPEATGSSDGRPENGELLVYDQPTQPGNRLDNKWIQYDRQKRPLTVAEWNETRYLHKQYYGYWAWPQPFLEMYAPDNEQPSLTRPITELNEQELVIFNFFNSKDNVEKLIHFLSMEEKKGVDKFSGSRFMLFKVNKIIVYSGFGNILAQ